MKQRICARTPFTRLAAWALQSSVLMLFMLAIASSGHSGQPGVNAAQIAARLKAAYPDQIAQIDGNVIVFTGGGTLPLDDGKGEKATAEWLANPDIKDMFRQSYPAGTAAALPEKDFDPGRPRNTVFFEKIYGDCRKSEVEKNLTEVIWLPKKAHQKLMVTKINGVAEKLKAVSDTLDQLPGHFDPYLFPTAGTYTCRAIAGTKNPSAHGYGIAIDIALKHAHYWRWSKDGPDGTIYYKNEIPMEVVAAFEAQGFIWGGRWYHYDTMHFEYRPELIARSSAVDGAAPASQPPVIASPSTAAPIITAPSDDAAPSHATPPSAAP